MNSILLVGTVSNVEKKLKSDFYRVYKAISGFDKIDVFLVESDSTDSTLEVLAQMKLDVLNFNYVSLGTLKESIPDRIERIRFCRNNYVDYIRINFPLGKWDRIAVADLDGMNTTIKRSYVNNLFTQSVSWDACFANQKHGYYDLFALRHSEWMPNNCFFDLAESRKNISTSKLRTYQLNERIRRFLRYDLTRRDSIYNRMKVLPKDSNWIKVDSAFGGFAIYKTNWFLKYDYSKYAHEIFTNSEHVDFNLKCVSSGANFYIVPSLMNSGWNEYNINRFFIIRQVRRFFWNHLRLRRLFIKVFAAFFTRKHH
jgi:hypothetical protein